MVHDYIQQQRDLLQTAIAGLDAVLPIQAPLQDFIHFNPLMNYEHLPFAQALRQVYEQSGSIGYLPATDYRKCYKHGRINRHDINSILEQDNVLASERELYLTILVNNIKAISFQQMRWQVEENRALEQFQSNVAFEQREKLLEAAEQSEAVAIQALWEACLQRLELNYDLPHPEALLNLRLKNINEVWDSIKQQGMVGETADADSLITEQSRHQLLTLLGQVGDDITLRTLLKRLTNLDIMEEIQPQLTRYMATWLDQGIASLHSQRAMQGFYAFWRHQALQDITPWLEGLETWRDYVSSLDDDPLETIRHELIRIGIDKAHWGAYLRTLALELPGWSGMFNWRGKRPQYLGLDVPVELADYLAVRLVLEHLYARRIMREHWHLDAAIPEIRGYFNQHLDEFFVRYHAYNTNLPEYLEHLALEYLESQEDVYPSEWKQLAHQILTWNLAPEVVIPVGTDIYRKAWRLFQLCQHLGLPAAVVLAYEQSYIERMLAVLEQLDDPNTSGYIWLRAYEYHYQQEIFSAILNKPSETASAAPKAQLIFCMDDREESVRRHLEELAPDYETLGAAGVFGMPNNWQALDAPKPLKLAQPVVTAVHSFLEVPDPEDLKDLAAHEKRQHWFSRLRQLKNHGMRQSVWRTFWGLAFMLPYALGELIGRTLSAGTYQRWFQKRETLLGVPLTTRVDYTATEVLACPTLEHNQLGLSQDEKVKQVANFLKLTGFTQDFSELVVLMAHRSRQMNNPHILGYGCGACSGRFGIPNARAFVSSVNEPEIKARLAAEHDIHIPPNSWWVAGDHDTTSDDVAWPDADLVPATHRTLFQQVQQAVKQAVALSAHERCRKFASAPTYLTAAQAKRHVENRAASPDQVRAELGHQGCAVAFIAPRRLSKHVFWDRRSFLISYNPTQDPEGRWLEAQLQGNGVVGIGIAMDYYFSRMQNGYFGSGSKATHNLTGLFGVMEGASSDLRTGLAQQMVELHEPMRLLVVVEAELATLGLIYARHAYLKQLLDNEWVLLAVKPPNTNEIYQFKAGKGFVRWEGMVHKLPQAPHSTDWYLGHHGYLPPALITGDDHA